MLGSARIGVAAAPSPFRNWGGLPSVGFGSNFTKISSSSATPAPLRADTKQIGITASINANGNGILLTDTAAGGGKMKVEDVDSTTAADLKINGTAAATTIDGSFEKALVLLESQSVWKHAHSVTSLGVW